MMMISCENPRNSKALICAPFEILLGLTATKGNQRLLSSPTSENISSGLSLMRPNVQSPSSDILSSSTSWHHR